MTEPRPNPAQFERSLTIFAQLFLGGVALSGLLWNATNLPITSQNLFGSLLAADLARALFFGLGLLVVGLIAINRFRGPNFALLRGAGRALALAGGYALLGGLLLAVQRMLPWQTLPDVFRPLLTIFYGGLILWTNSHYFFRDIQAGGKINLFSTIWLGLGLGCLVSAGWVIAGSLGTLAETLLALLEALGMGLLGAIFMTVVFYDAPDFLREHPGRVVAWAALVYGSLTPILFAVRGWSTQGAQIGFVCIFFGFAAAGLLVGSPSRRNWLPLFAALFAALALPLIFTKGAEGDWVPGGLPAAGVSASQFSLAACALLGVVQLVWRPFTERVQQRPLFCLAAGCLGMAILPVIYFSASRPGLQPDTFFVVMAEQADTRSAEGIPDQLKRRETVFQALTRTADRTQTGLRAELERRGIPYTPYYLVNGMEVFGPPGLRQEIAARPDVARVLDSPHMRPQPPVNGTLNLAEQRPKPADLPWGIKSIHADQVWQTWGITGQGIIVGAIGNGVDWRHPDLQANYLGGQNNHDYTWYDPWEHTTEPIDTNGIGTHTLGTVLGRNGFGVAPGARWIACRSLARDLGNLPLYLDCMQFLLAPFPQSGNAFRDGVPGRGAQIVNSEFICPPYEGCDAVTLSLAVTNLRRAGQLFVTGAGNEGPTCSTILPPGLAGDALTVGALGEDGQAAPFSSRGPVSADGSGRIKPDLVAPGYGIISDLPDGRYAEFHGTSMAAAHVTGVAALLWSATPALKGNIQRTRDILLQSANPIPNGSGCGGSGQLNNISGAGAVDAFAAVKLALENK